MIERLNFVHITARKLSAHHQQQLIAHLLGDHGQLLGVRLGGGDIMHAARPNDRQQTPIAPVDDIANGGPSADDALVGGGRRRQLRLKGAGRDDRAQAHHVKVLGGGSRGGG